jgi:hypothetical protein
MAGSVGHPYVGDKKLYGAELVQITTEKVRIIKDRMKVA